MTVVEPPFVTVAEVTVLPLPSLKTTVSALEPPQGSVTVTVKLTWSETWLTLKVDEPAGPLDEMVISFVK